MGKVIVIEGVSDGVGKTTQVKELYKKLVDLGKEVIYHHFPSYGSVGASLVEAYLKGDLGKREEIGPYAISSFYAVDRFYTYHNKLKDALNSGKIVLLDRYTTSNMAHQGSKILDKDERFYMYQWIDKLEYWLLGLPKPDKTIFLHMPYEYSLKLEKTRDVLDEHEKDSNYLKRSEEAYIELSELYGWDKVECIKDGEIKTIPEINEEIMNILLKK